MENSQEPKYPFNKVWDKIYHFNNYPLIHFVDSLYKYRQMEEMWLIKAKEEKDFDLVKLCNHNIRYLDTKIAYEEESYQNKLKNKTSSNYNNNKFNKKQIKN